MEFNHTPAISPPPSPPSPQHPIYAAYCTSDSFKITRFRKLRSEFYFCSTISRGIGTVEVTVKEVYEADKEKVSDLTPSGVRNHFYRGLNEPVMKHVFHVLNPDIDTSEIINSAASGLYCTLFSNMCAYILQHRVKLDDRTAAADELIFRNFKDCAMEAAFKDVTPEDIPLRPRKASGAKRQRKEKLPPLLKRDDAFRVFGPPPGITPRQPRALVERQRLGLQAASESASEAASEAVTA